MLLVKNVDCQIEMSSKTMFIRCFLIAAIITYTSAITGPTSVVLENNGYKNILVAIHPKIPEDKTLIDRIKAEFSKASSYLYNATYYRAYFQEIQILIPSTWSSDPSYTPATTQRYDNAHVAISSSSSTNSDETGRVETFHTELPRTRSFGGCGKPGVRINLAPKFFHDNNLKMFVGPPDRILVHEWGRFRWGVFSEYAEDGEEQFYFSPISGKLEAVRCSVNMQGRIYRMVDGKLDFCFKVDPATGRYKDGCLFSPYEKGSKAEYVSASIMHRTMVKGIKYFCDDSSSDQSKVHNYEAPNRHNRICGHRSTWSVILDSADFKGNNNPPRIIPNVVPTFSILHAAATRRIALVMDSSNSMMDDEGFTQLRQAAADHINSGISTGSQVGVVTFSDDAKVLYPMTTINTNQDRQKVKNSLPRSTRGATSIGSGIEKALELLNNQGQGGAEILVITDGRETESPKIDDILHKINKSGVTLSVLVLSQNSEDAITNAVHQSAGRFYSANDQDKSTTLSDSLFTMRKDPNSKQENPSVQLTSKAGKILPGNDLTGDVSVDEDVGRNTIFTIMYTKQEPTITITSPTGRIYNKHYPEYQTDGDFNTVRIEIPEIAEAGTWTYKVVNNFSQIQKLSIMVVSDSVDTEREPVKVEGVLSSSSVALPDRISIHAEVTKSSHPVTGLQVTAIIDRPYSPSVTLELLDNGAGSDITKNDGIYSRYFTQFTDAGRYNVKIEAVDSKGTATVWKTSYKKPPLTPITDDFSIRPKREVSQLPLNMPISRTTTAGSFVFSRGNGSTFPAPPSSDQVVDIWPPARITDLAVLKTSHEEQTIQLSWTAPGGDLDIDTAFSYEMMISHNVADMIHNQKSWRLLTQNDVVYGQLDAPKKAGVAENFVVKVLFNKKNNSAFVLSVRAIDKHSNIGDKSNFVTAAFGYLPDYTSPDYVPLANVVTEQPIVPSAGEINALVGIVGSMAVAICLTIIFSVLLQRYYRYKSTKTVKYGKSGVV